VFTQPYAAPEQAIKDMVEQYESLAKVFTGQKPATEDSADED
jgi:hypothetical protein